MTNQEMETLLLETLRRSGNPAAPEALLEPLEDPDQGAAAIERLLSTGRVMLTRKRKLALPEQMGLRYGRVQGNARGFGFFIPADGTPDLFLPADAIHGAMHGDMVWVRQTDQISRGGNPEAEVALIASRGQKKIVGTFEDDEGAGGGYVVPDDTRLYMDVLIRPGDVDGAKQGDKVVAEILQYPDGRRPLTGRVVEVLGSKEKAGTDILSIIRRMDLPDDFSKTAARQARNLNKPVASEEIARREDLRALPCITIDGADAKDLDDAVSLVPLEGGNCLLGVHIADVSHYVTPQSPLDQEAYKRGTSVYFPDRVLPMLPKEISNGVCSLNPNTEKLTLSCIMELDPAGKVVSHRLAETVIRTRYRMTYEDVNAMFDGDKALLETYKDIWPMLSNMGALMEKLRNRRFKRGSMDFDLAEAKLILDKKGHTVDVKLYERGISNQMIEEFMLLANETVANHARQMGIPFLYRVHETPDKEKLQQLNTFLHTLGYGIKSLNNLRPATLQKVLLASKGTKEEAVISRVTLRSLRKARYAPECLGHFGLAIGDYCHFTSPIRRYPDLTVHRLLKAMLHGELDETQRADWAQRMEEIAQHCSQRELAALEAERAADDLKKCEYMKDRIGAVETGIISGVAQYGFFVQLPNTVEGMVRIGSMEDDYYILDEQNYRMVGRSTGKVYRLGDQVTIRVTGADLETGNVDFVLERSAGSQGKKKDGEGPGNGRRRSQAKGRSGQQGGKAQASHKVEAVSGEKKSPGHRNTRRGSGGKVVKPAGK
ncbi:MAG TPA: ribonuclease R [Candidatus Pelethousia gallinarum]|nr:ribonuclease R [Candidatus Pelethousia gallinarum]